MLALLQHPLQVLAFSANVPLDRNGPQHLGPRENNDGMFPHVFPEQADVLLDASAVHVGEHTHRNDQQEGVGSRGAESCSSDQLLFIGGRGILGREPSRGVHDRHLSTIHLRLPLYAELRCSLQTKLLSAYDCVPCQALPRPPPAQNHQADLIQTDGCLGGFLLRLFFRSCSISGCGKEVNTESQLGTINRNISFCYSYYIT